MPRISILLPAFNAAATIGACLASISRQTERDWECVVVDDGSTDRTAAIARRIAARDPRIRVISIPHGGVVSALNAGLSTCRAPLIARMDADDVMHRERLAIQARVLDEDPSLAGVGCHVRFFPRAAMSPRLREYEDWLNGLRSADDVARDAFIECPIAHPSLMIRREALQDGYADCGWPEDYDLVLRALTSDRRIGTVPRRLLLWRDGAARLSRVDPRYSLERFTACRSHYLAQSFLRGDTYVLWGYGATGRALHRALAALGKRASHIVEVKRTRIGQRIHGALVIPADALDQVHGVPVVVSVARAGPRAEIREAMARMGFVEGQDFVCAA
jgi:glycosyltransferase involved in cell wall biosynthesis